MDSASQADDQTLLIKSGFYTLLYFRQSISNLRLLHFFLFLSQTFSFIFFLLLLLLFYFTSRLPFSSAFSCYMFVTCCDCSDDFTLALMRWQSGEHLYDTVRDASWRLLWFFFSYLLFCFLSHFFAAPPTYCTFSSTPI